MLFIELTVELAAEVFKLPLVEPEVEPLVLLSWLPLVLALPEVVDAEVEVEPEALEAPEVEVEELVEPLVLELLEVEVEVEPLAAEVEVLPLSEVEALLILVELVLLLFDEDRWLSS